MDNILKLVNTLLSKVEYGEITQYDLKRALTEIVIQIDHESTQIGYKLNK